MSTGPPAAASPQQPEPSDAVGWFLRGAALADAGRHEEALRAYARAAEVDPVETADSPYKAAALSRFEERRAAMSEPATPAAPAPAPAEARPAEARPAEPAGVVTLVGRDGMGGAQGAVLAISEVHTTGVPAVRAEAQPVPAPEASVVEASVVEASVVESPVAAPAPAVRPSEPDPRNADGWCRRATALSRVGRYEEALHAYVRAIQHDPGRAEAWHYCGVTLARLDRHTEALDAYTRSIGLEPGNAAAWISRGATLDRLGHHDEALAAYTRATDLDTTTPGRRRRPAR